MKKFIIYNYRRWIYLAIFCFSLILFIITIYLIGGFFLLLTLPLILTQLFLILIGYLFAPYKIINYGCMILCFFCLIILCCITFRLCKPEKEIVSKDRSAVYYVARVDLYIKVYNPAYHDYYYVYLSKKNDFSNKAKTACIRVWKSDIIDVDIFIDPQANNEMFITNQSENIFIDNQGSFTIKIIDWKDPVFFKLMYSDGILTYITKKPYLTIEIFFTKATLYETQKDSVVVLKDISINDK